MRGAAGAWSRGFVRPLKVGATDSRAARTPLDAGEEGVMLLPMVLRNTQSIDRRSGVPTPEDAEEQHGHQDGRGGRATATPRHALHALCQQPQVQQAEAYARPKAAHPKRRTPASGPCASGEGGKTIASVRSVFYTEWRAVALQSHGQEDHVAPRLDSPRSPMRRLDRITQTNQRIVQDGASATGCTAACGL